MSHEDDTDPDTGPSELPTAERGYIIPAKDVHGHSTRLYCTAIPATGRMLVDIRDSKKYPFRTVGDVVRWCITDGVRRLARGAGIPSVMGQVSAMIAVLQDEEFQQQFLEYFAHLRRVIESYIEAGSQDEARRVIGEARGYIAGLEEGYWKTRYSALLLERYRVLIDADDARQLWDDATAAPDAEAEAAPLAREGDPIDDAPLLLPAFTLVKGRSQ